MGAIFETNETSANTKAADPPQARHHPNRLTPASQLQIVVRNASTAGSGPRDYRAGVGTYVFNKATLQFGDAASVGAQTFTMAAPNSSLSTVFPDLVISNASAAHTLQKRKALEHKSNLQKSENGKKYLQKKKIELLMK